MNRNNILQWAIVADFRTDWGIRINVLSENRVAYTHRRGTLYTVFTKIPRRYPIRARRGTNALRPEFLSGRLVLCNDMLPSSTPVLLKCNIFFLIFFITELYSRGVFKKKKEKKKKNGFYFYFFFFGGFIYQRKLFPPVLFAVVIVVRG